MHWTRLVALSITGALVAGLLASCGAGGTTGSGVSRYSISGTANGAASVTITLSGAATGSTTSDEGGTYIFSNIENGSYTLTPNKHGYTFSPTSLNVAVNDGNVTGQNFTATVAGSTHSISGAVSGAIYDGILITLSGAMTGGTTTASGGLYSFSGLADGSYTVTPSKSGYSFSPPSATVTLLGTDVTGVNFAAQASGGVLAWPNSISSANSDAWLASHHDQISAMHPQVLTLNFVNAPGASSQVSQRVSALIRALSEGSRYHAYSDSSATTFLDYTSVKIVDLTDKGSPPDGWTHLNSSKYPVKCYVGAPYPFDYSALFSDAFTAAYAIPDPLAPSRNLSLCEMFQRGIVNEVWLYVDGDADSYTCPSGVHWDNFEPMEIVESRQQYDSDGNKAQGQFTTCANGCMGADDAVTMKACGVTIRILYINSTRGIGCAVHSLGHGIEWMARQGFGGSLPYMIANFSHFANFDLRTRLGLPFDDWYSCDSSNCISFTSDNSLAWSAQGHSGTITRYDQGCGSVHFSPNSRFNYDDRNAAAVVSTCEHFGLRDGPGGDDLQEIYTAAKSQLYDDMTESDCGGGWQIYWRQSFPGYQNHATAVDGKPMKNWWPFLFY